jgi:hypothetical protein
MGFCGRGPVTRALKDGERFPSTDINVNSFENMMSFMESKAGIVTSPEISEIAELKYKARRMEDEGKRMELMDTCLEKIDTNKAGVDVEAQNKLSADVLAMRARVRLRSEPAKALKDAGRAVELAPGWAQGLVAYALACEAMHRPKKGLEAAEAALQTGQCVNEEATEKLVSVLKNKAKDEDRDPVQFAKLRSMLENNALMVSGRGSGEKQIIRQLSDLSDADTAVPESYPGSRRGSKSSTASSVPGEEVLPFMALLVHPSAYGRPASMSRLLDSLNSGCASLVNPTADVNSSQFGVLSI